MPSKNMCLIQLGWDFEIDVIYKHKIESYLLRKWWFHYVLYVSDFDLLQDKEKGLTEDEWKALHTSNVQR